MIIYSFVLVKDPKLVDMSPRKGPIAGGTKVVISGQHLDAGTDINIRIGQTSCTNIK